MSPEIFFLFSPLDVDSLFFISNMLAASVSNIGWRPVVAVLIGAFFYVICLPLATRVPFYLFS